MERSIRMLFQILFLLLAFLFLFQVDCSLNFSSSFHHSLPSCLPQQSSALLQFKNTIRLSEYCDVSKINSWNQSIDCCLWEGVSCHKLTGHVIGINLSDSCLHGPLLGNNSLFLLQSLQWLDLSSNNLDGPLLENSSVFRHLHGLQQLNLAYNSFNGSISSRLFNRRVSLTHLNLSSCEFSGLVPYEISLLSNLVSLDLSTAYRYTLSFDSQGFNVLARNLTKLTNLALDYVDMSGVSLTSFLNLTSSLEHLSLEYCDLRGEFPSQVFGFPYLRHISLRGNYDATGILPSTNLSLALELLDLSLCSFKGSIPTLLGNLSKIVSLDLSNSDFGGKIPSVLFNLPQLLSLDLAYNRLEGTLPNHVHGLQFLGELSLCNNLISGGVPSWLFTLPSLSGLYLSNNKLNGSIDHVQKPKSSLSKIDLSQNKIQGPIPNFIFELPSLTTLNLSNNTLEGNLPNHIQKPSTSLSKIDLSFNNIQCPIPDFFFEFPSLTTLDLSNNRLEGNLPNHIQKPSTSLGEIDLSFNNIQCPIPDFFFELPSLTTLDLSNNRLEGNLPNHIQKPSTSLGEIDLSFNNIQCPIPDFFFELPSLTTLKLSSNNFSGVVKSSKIAKLKNLSELDLSNNSLLSLGTDGNHFDHPIFFKRLSFSSSNITQFPNFLQYSNLDFLNLSHNKISGGIKKWEAKGWKHLRTLDLSYNSLIFLERIPGNPSSLDLRSNLLQDTVLSNCSNLSNSTNIEFFSISKNNLSGNIPNSICSWGVVKVLDFSENKLNGTIPPCLGNFTSLKFMNLGMNNLHGEIPDSFTNNSLTNLLLNDNQLEGFIPRSLANCSSLTLLNLGNNKLVDTFPTWLASLSSLQVLILSFNRLHGSLPNSMATSNFSTLRIIDVSHNEFTGHLPIKLFQYLRAMKHVPHEKISPEEFSSNSKLIHRDCIFCRERYSGFDGFYETYVNVTSKRMEMKLVKILTIFYSMDFSSNLFSGRIPEELGELMLLHALNFSNNNLIGPIPSSLGNMVALESLDLSSNKLSGRIPSQLTNLTFLEVLDLSENDLVGPIPTGRQLDTFENDSYRGNLGLCGLPLSKQCSSKEGPKPPPLMHVKHEGSTIEIPFIWKVAMMGYGCGAVLGLSMGYIVFTTGRPWWFVRKVERDWQTRVTNWISRNRKRRN